MRIAVLTSSRADYGIYFPLLMALKQEPGIELSILAFGTHLSGNHGYTVQQIFDDGFDPILVDTVPENDSPKGISECMGKTILSFASVWEKHHFDLVFSLGDRYEMFAACASGLPFNIKFAHISGGEQTAGAIDEVFRHSLTHMSALHFVSTRQYSERVAELKGSTDNVYNVGALSIDNLKKLQLYSVDEFNQRFAIDLSKPSILITFHPETVSYRKNEEYIETLIAALKEIRDYQLIITMPNADTSGTMVREKLIDFINANPEAKAVESFGMIGYLSCMKHCSFMLGNTSSGFIEASFFPKYVINLGTRQEGRIVTDNIKNVAIEKGVILEAVSNFKKFVPADNGKIYGTGDAAKNIVDVIKKYS